MQFFWPWRISFCLALAEQQVLGIHISHNLSNGLLWVGGGNAIAILFPIVWVAGKDNSLGGSIFSDKPTTTGRNFLGIDGGIEDVLDSLGSILFLCLPKEEGGLDGGVGGKKWWKEVVLPQCGER